MQYTQHIFSKLYFHLIGYHMFHALALSAGVVVSVAFQQVDCSPNAEAGTEGDDEGLENADSRVEKFHICVAGIIGCWWC